MARDITPVADRMHQTHRGGSKNHFGVGVADGPIATAKGSNRLLIRETDLDLANLADIDAGTTA
ncbi:hypothetical protein [Brevibacterium sp. 1718]|uniref:hypothetical protein n=1 Tax=Brevibacterium sp. 1718 TaxID=3413510 RepID=UPI003DA7F92E